MDKQNYWNLRVIEKFINGEKYYSVHEVHYTEKGIYGYTIDPVNISGDSIEDIKEYCQMILKCLENPVLIESEIKLVDNDL